MLSIGIVYKRKLLLNYFASILCYSYIMLQFTVKLWFTYKKQWVDSVQCMQRKYEREDVKSMYFKNVLSKTT